MSMRYLDSIAGMLLAMITIVGFVNVIMRYIFANPIPWVGEMSVLGMVWMICLSQGMLENEDSQLRMTAFYRILPARLQSGVNLLRSTLTTFLFCYLIYSGSGVIAQNYNLRTTTQAIGFPLWIAYLALPVAFVMMTLARILEPFVKHADDARGSTPKEGGA
ncbi:MAG: TRAP transporter small permease [Desulfobacterales bacterium]|nr:MAG: TRAP transporter small permease [Desulfobacterales bacterium]